MTAYQFALAYVALAAAACLFAGAMALVAMQADRINSWIERLEAKARERKSKSLSCQVWGP